MPNDILHNRPLSVKGYHLAYDRATDEELVRAFVAATSDLSLREAAELVGVSHDSVRRWRAGAAGKLKPATRRALRQYIERVREERRAREAAGNTIRNLEAYARFQIARVGPPGKHQARKRDILHGLRLIITATDPLPDWWYELKEAVEKGEA